MREYKNSIRNQLASKILFVTAAFTLNISIDILFFLSHNNVCCITLAALQKEQY